MRWKRTSSTLRGGHERTSAKRAARCGRERSASLNRVQPLAVAVYVTS
ncbi:hypothetical protein [Streptosporangium sp. NBC_01756]|nr:hypothetical protein [Streptosporangium sp. NBC_01756]WSC84945.1 hypothetical protein OIE48_31935 [Streptosporangium sp. NBC_01756]